MMPSSNSLFAVTGRPILHSQSPALFEAAFQALGIDASYTRIAVSSAEEAIRVMRQAGIRGLNVTSPFKGTVANLMDSLDQASITTGAVNTVTTDGTRLFGHNTDVSAAVEALRHRGIDPRGAKAVVLGAGGAGKAAAWGLACSGASEVVIVNRTVDKARQAAERIGCRFASMDEVHRELLDADILVSCLSTAEPVVDAGSLKPGLVVLDANYKARAVEQAAVAVGCRVVPGIDWLVHQASASFEIFTGAPAPIEAMRTGLDRGPKGSSRIALVGFMGSGKSEVVRCLAGRLGLEIVDTDEWVERAAERSISEIFAERGEETFRYLEKAVLKEALDREGAVIACGGGAMLDTENRSLLMEHTLVVWLWISLDTALSRAGDGSRPLLAEKGSGDAAAKLFQDRLPGYGEVADLLVSSENGTPDDIAALIQHEIDQAFPH